MGSSYAVYLFMGNYTANSTAWALDRNLVGIHGVFANMRSNNSWAMVQSMGMGDLKTTGSIPLTTMLIDKVASGVIASLSPEHVEPYLTHALDWRVAYYDGTEIPINTVMDLSISVVQSLVTPAVSHDQFPVWGPFRALVNVTAAKPGGHNSEYWNCPEDGTPYGPDYGMGGASSTVLVGSTVTAATIVAATSYGRGGESEDENGPVIESATVTSGRTVTESYTVTTAATAAAVSDGRNNEDDSAGSIIVVPSTVTAASTVTAVAYSHETIIADDSIDTTMEYTRETITVTATTYLPLYSCQCASPLT